MTARSIYAAAYEDDIRAEQWPQQLPAGFNPERLRWLVSDSAHELGHWQLVQTNDQGELICRTRTAAKVM